LSTGRRDATECEQDEKPGLGHAHEMQRSR
jgi:hypothetical protein